MLRRNSRTSFGIGGPADFFLELAKAEGIEKVITAAREKEIPYFLLGAGTNLLIADGGVEGLVVRVVTREHHIDGTRITAAAGSNTSHRYFICAAKSGIVRRSVTVTRRRPASGSTITNRLAVPCRTYS